MKPGTPPIVGTMIDLALEEDLGRGDITTRLTVPSKSSARGRLVARQSLILSGLDVFFAVMHRVDPDIQCDSRRRDGEEVSDGEVFAEVSGTAASLLMAERVALNFLQRLCGTATITRQYVDAIPPDCSVRLVDTRKTTPGLRYLERQAVIHGGGGNHRVDLGGGILIKENHIAAAGSVEEAVARCRSGGPHPLRVEVEVQDEAELREALAAGADIIMLDNMSIDEMRRCVGIANHRAILEASGGVSLGTVAEIARTGVDVISVGAFTHSAPSADISFLIGDIRV